MSVTSSKSVTVISRDICERRANGRQTAYKPFVDENDGDASRAFVYPTNSRISASRLSEPRYVNRQRLIAASIRFDAPPITFKRR